MYIKSTLKLLILGTATVLFTACGEGADGDGDHNDSTATHQGGGHGHGDGTGAGNGDGSGNGNGDGSGNGMEGNMNADSNGGGDMTEMPLVDHSMWTTILTDAVDTKGNVDYAKIKEDSNFPNYIAQLQRNHPDDEWTADQKKAYWINAYNAFTVKLILDNWPVESIMNLDDGKVWDRKWVEIGDNTYSLGEIENKKLREETGDARIHFAVNCASVSCPRLAREAYQPAKLDGQLEAMTKDFINNKKANELDADNPKVSKLFEWYKDDFVKSAGSVIAFINKYADNKINEGATLGYKEYDWNLNGTK